MAKLDFDSIADPQQVPAWLEACAASASESASDLHVAWQDKDAGKPWEIISAELSRAASIIQTRLAKHYA